jgi:RNA polymerase sigma-70 factor (ECF subfamily)
VTDEKLLIDRAQKGDAEAFRQLVERSKITTYALAYDLTGNRHDAEDISQESYIRAFRGLAGFRGEAKWSTWMHRITVNTFLDHKRSRRTETVEYNDEIDDTVNTRQHTPNPGPDRTAEARLIQGHIDRALDALSPQERSVFVLRHYQDMPIKQIAATMDLADGTVKVHLFRAIRKLQKALKFYRPDGAAEGRPA